MWSSQIPNSRDLEDVPDGQAVRIVDVVGDSYLVECDSPKCKGLADIHNFVLLEPFLEEARTDHTREAEWMIARQKDGHLHVVVRDTVFKTELQRVPNGRRVRIVGVLGDSYLVECDFPKCKGPAKIHNFVQGD